MGSRGQACIVAKLVSDHLRSQLFRPDNHLKGTSWHDKKAKNFLVEDEAKTRGQETSGSSILPRNRMLPVALSRITNGKPGSGLHCCKVGVRSPEIATFQA